MKSPAVLTVALMLCIYAGVAQESGERQAYDLDEAYAVYSGLLPQEESFGFATGTLVIHEETVPNPDAGACLTKEAAKKFRDAVSNFARVNSKDWALQRHFKIEKPYELVSEDTIRAALVEGDWENFYKRYPGSGGYITLSAVGFNPDKTQAIVYSGSQCGNLCGRWSFHLLEKVGGKWKEAPGVTCLLVS